MFPLFQIRCSGLRLGFRVNVYGLGFMLAGLKSNFDLSPGLKSIFVLSPTTPCGFRVGGWGCGFCGFRLGIVWVSG